MPCVPVSCRPTFSGPGFVAGADRLRSPFAPPPLTSPPPPPEEIASVLPERLELSSDTVSTVQEREDRRPLARLFARASLVAASLMLPGTPLAAVAVPPVAVQAAPVPLDTQAPAFVDAVHAILEPESRHLAPELARYLQGLPPGFLRAAGSSGVRVWLKPAGVEHVPATLFREDGQPLDEVENAWKKWHKAPSAAHGLMSLPDHRSAFVSPLGDVSVGDAATGQLVPYGKVSTLKDLAHRWGQAVYGTDLSTLPSDRAELEHLLAVMNPDLDPAAPLPAGREIYLPVSVPYQGQSMTTSTMTLVAELNASLPGEPSPRFFQFSDLLVIPEASLHSTAGSDRAQVLEGLGRVALRLIDEDGRYGFEHSSELAALAAEAQERGLDASLADPVDFYARAFAEYFAPSAAGSPAGKDGSSWATTRPLIERDLRWLQARQDGRPPSAPPALDEPSGGAATSCQRIPGPADAVRTEMLDTVTLQERYGRNAPLLEEMADPGSRKQFGTAIQHDLGIVPTGVLQQAKDKGLRIHVLPGGATTIPARLIPEDAAGPFPAARTVRVETDRIPLNGRDRVAPPPFAGRTLADVARDHGARSPEEVQRFVEIAAQQNGLDSSVRLEAGQTLKVPDLYFYEGRSYTLERRREIEQMNQAAENSAGFFRFWEDRSVAPILVVKEKHLCTHTPDAPQKNILLHEMGHVTEYLALDDSGYREAHNLEMLQIRASAVRTPSEMLTGYSRVHPAEEYADAFEAYFTADRPGAPPSPDQANDAALTASNPRLRSLIERDLQRLAGEG